MTQLQDEMKAAAATLSAQHGVTTDQVQAIVAQANAPFIASLTATINSEKDNATKIDDIEASLDEFSAGINPAPAPAPTPTPAPAPAPTPAPAPEPAPAPASSGNGSAA